jgi:hypothetical protein
LNAKLSADAFFLSLFCRLNSKKAIPTPRTISAQNIFQFPNSFKPLALENNFAAQPSVL